MTRTVSLLPAATEVVAALRLLDELVGVSHECDFPPGVGAKPRVTRCEAHGLGLPSAEIDRWVAETLRAGGPLYTLDGPLLRELAPDLILTQGLCDVCAPAHGSVAALAAALPSRPRVLSLEPRTLADILGTVREVAAAMGRPDRAGPVVAGLEGRVAAVTRRAAGRPRQGVFVLEWADPLFAAGHWTPELVTLAGGTPVLAAAGRDSVRVGWPDLRAADPDVLLIACCGHTVERAREDLPLLERLPGWAGLRAVRGRRVYLADGSAYFSRPGPRVVDALELLAAVLHPDPGSNPAADDRAVPVY